MYMVMTLLDGGDNVCTSRNILLCGICFAKPCEENLGGSVKQ